MKRLWSAVVIGGVLAAGAAFAAEIDEGRQDAILEIVDNTCVSCHGVNLVGGVGPALTPEAIGGKDTAMLADAIVNGRPGTPMPPFSGMLDDDEARWLVERLQAGLPHD